MLPINQYITVRNRTISNRSSIQYLVIHYVGAVSSAQANCQYFYSTYRGASAHYFVDDNSIWQCVLDKDAAWHCGTNGTYYNGCRNSNSIGIEMCCFNNGGTLDMSDKTINNTLELAAYICKKYGISIDRVVRHYDVTHKSCPAPFVSNPARWTDFKNRLAAMIGGQVVAPSTPSENNTMNKVMTVTANGGLNVRSGAGTGYGIVGGLSKGAQVTVYEMSNGWARIGSGQWVSAAYLSEGAQSSSSTKTMYVTANGGLNVRSGAGTQYRVLKTIPKGSAVTVYAESNGWSRVGDGQWVSSQYLSGSSASTGSSNGTYKVTANGGLNIRSGAGTGYGVVGGLSNGATVTVYETSNGWGRIGDGKWVSMQYLSKTGGSSNSGAVTRTVNVNTGLNVRSGAGTQYRVLKSLSNGTRVTVYETSNGWSRIGVGQWVNSQYLK